MTLAALNLPRPALRVALYLARAAVRAGGRPLFVRSVP